MSSLREHALDPGADNSRVSFEKSKEASKHFESSSPDPTSRRFSLNGNADGLKRDLSNRKVQLVAIGGSIGTALFLSIGGVLNKAGPGNLFLAFFVYNIMLALVNNCMAEMSVYMPVSGGFIRMAGKWVDEALGFMVGWNFFFYQVVVIPFEITALSLVLSYWSDNIPVAAICGGCIVLYACLNIYAVAVYGEAEFWLSSGKVFLILLLFAFTFVTMVGGNPQGDAYGFRHWKTPGAFAEYATTGTLGQFEGFLVALWSASFTCVGPEYVSMMAAEAKHPRVYVKTAFKVVYWRLAFFFLGGALAVGILVPYNDPTLTAIFSGASGSSGSAAASPYIIAMSNLGIDVLPHIVTTLIATTIFSAGNTYTYCATRSLYGLALEGRAPKVLRKCTKKGVPIYCFGVVMLFPFLSFLQLSASSATVLGWLINLATGATVIDYIVICTTYICFHRACKAQGFDRSKLPYFGRFQPWSGYIALGWMILIVTCYGYQSFQHWDVGSFFTHYGMVMVAPVLFIGWKLIKGTKFIRAEDVDLIWDAPFITAYEEALCEPPIGFWREVWQYFRFKKAKGGNEIVSSSVA